MLFLLLPILTLDAAGEVAIEAAHDPENPVLSDPIQVEAVVTGEDIGRVELWYQTCEGNVCNMPVKADMTESGDKYTATMGPFNDKTTKCDYKINVYDGAGGLLESSEPVHIEFSNDVEEDGSEEGGGKEENKGEESMIPGYEAGMVLVGMGIALIILHNSKRR